MKRKQRQELKNMTEQELYSQLDQKQKKLFDMGVQHKSAPLKNPLLLRETRRDIARIKTLFRVKFNKK